MAGARTDVPLEQVLEGLVVVRVPMRVPFRGVDHREVALLHGPSGWGEFSPFLEYGDDEAATWLASALEAGWGSWPAPVRERVPVNATVPAVPTERVDEVLARFDGCTTAKVKVAEVGQGLERDVARVARVRQLLGPDAAVRVDANGGWSVNQAQRALARLQDHDLQYAEQPCRTVPELVALHEALRRDGIDVRLAADESIRKADDPYAVAESGAVDVAVVKVAPLGGVARTVQIASELSSRYGVQVVVSSALDTSVGMSAGVAAAAALPMDGLACGLGTVGLLGADVVGDPLLAVGGHLEVRRPVPEPDLMASLLADRQREQWWRERVIRCHSILSATSALEWTQE